MYKGDIIRNQLEFEREIDRNEKNIIVSFEIVCRYIYNLYENKFTFWMEFGNKNLN